MDIYLLFATSLATFLVVITPVYPTDPCLIGKPDLDNYVCDLEKSRTYKREGGTFKEQCGQESDFLDCSPCLKFNVSCNNNFTIYWSGNWLPVLTYVWSCTVSGNSVEDDYFWPINLTNDSTMNPLVIPAPSNYSSCKFGACYGSAEGWTYIADLTNCVPETASKLAMKTGEESTKGTDLEITTDIGVPKSTATLKSMPETSLESTTGTGLEITSHFGFPKATATFKSMPETSLESRIITLSSKTFFTKSIMTTTTFKAHQIETRLITLIVLPVVVLVLTILTVLMGCYILRQSYSRNHKRIKPQMVFPQGINVFDASFEPVSVELRIKLSESQESIYYSLDHHYEQISPTTQEKFAHTNHQCNSIGDDGYSVVKEPDNNNKEECTCINDNIRRECEESAKLRSYCQNYPEVNYDDSSGFVSTGFDYVDTRDCSDGNVKLQYGDFCNDPECLLDRVFYENDPNKIWPEVIEPMVHQKVKGETDDSPTNNFSNLEMDVFYNACDSEVDDKNPFCGIEYMEELCLTPPEDATDICKQQHCSSESDLSSDYVAASEVVDHHD